MPDGLCGSGRVQRTNLGFQNVTPIADVKARPFSTNQRLTTTSTFAQRYLRVLYLAAVLILTTLTSWYIPWDVLRLQACVEPICYISQPAKPGQSYCLKVPHLPGFLIRVATRGSRDYQALLIPKRLPLLKNYCGISSGQRQDLRCAISYQSLVIM